MSIDIGNTIRIIRQAKGLRLKEVAQAASVSMPFVCLVEKGEREPSLTVLRRIAKALDVPAEALILLSQPSGGKIQTKDARANGLIASIRRIATAEDSLRKQLEEDSDNGHEAVRSVS